MNEEQVKATLDELRKAALELAQYASYAEIVGGIRENRVEIRKWCDEVFRLHDTIQKREYAAEDALAATAE